MKTTSDKPDGEVRFAYGGRHISVRVTFRPGSQLSISVYPDQRVTAVAPVGTPLDTVAKRIERRARWIFRQLRDFERYRPLPTPRRYVSGETHLYLGKQYRLRVRSATSDRVRMRGGYIVVESASGPEPEHVKLQLDGWYRERARDVLMRRFAICTHLVRTLEIPQQQPLLRKMVRRWGSCGRAARILLNPDLVKVPVQCIDYVIVHELCHVKILHHNKRFFALMSRYMPDWQERKRRLDGIMLPASAGGSDLPADGSE